MNTKETKLQSGTISEEEYNKYKEKLEKDAAKKAELYIQKSLAQA